MSKETRPRKQRHEIAGRPRSMGGDVRWTNTPRTAAHSEGDVQALMQDLAHSLRGEVRFDSGSQGLYTTDSSNYRQVPIGLVVPRDAEDLVQAVAVCRRHDAPILHRGAGTGLAGQTTNAAVVIDGSKYLDRIVEVNLEERYARVAPGVRLDQLRQRTVPHGLAFGPDPSTHEYCTFGGMIGNNACGVHSQISGRTEDNVDEMEVLTYDGLRLRVGETPEEELERIIRQGGRRGEIYRRLRDLRDRYADLIRARYPDIPRRVSGYSLPALLPENGFHVARALVGTEGTCVTILEAKVRLIDWPSKRVMLVLGYPDIYDAGDDVVLLGETGTMALEGMDHLLIEMIETKGFHAEYLPLLPEGSSFLLLEFGGDTLDEARERARHCMDVLEKEKGSHAPYMRLIEDRNDQEKIFVIRESGLGVTAHQYGESWPGWEDSAVAPEQLGDYMRDLRKILEKHHLRGSFYGHFGQGLVHTRINFDLRSRLGVNAYRAFIDEASDLCVRYGGSLSGEHGDGQARAEMLTKMFGRELVQAFREFKEIWDPDWKMNPGKVVDPYRMDENLRLGADYDPPRLQTYFEFPEDGGSFAHAALRCVGVGKCRRREVGPEDVMCPSFLVTHEEMHTTRGRARLLFEMLNGDETPDAWRNDDVKEALDLCLACKGCKNDCPVRVDMATYKAEFLAHYYDGRLRPRAAYTMGLIYWWSRLASLMPRAANYFTQTPGISTLVKRLGGIAPQRRMPPFADETFKDWFFKRGVRNEGKERVLLWPDTFNNHFKPETGRAAVAVLEEAGYQVVVPRASLCCGRPLYDYGWLETARHLWHEILETLHDEIRAGTPLVGLEPSCVAAFRDELVNLFPHDEDARRLQKQTFTLAEFLSRQGYDPPKLERKAVVHGHCHHKSVMGFSPEEEMLRKMGLDFEVVAASCCGVAGSFGYEADHYDVSMACGEFALLPAVREADAGTLVITDGFSCKHQIGEHTDRKALHLAEVLHLALQTGGRLPDTYPERPYLASMHAPELRYEKTQRDGQANGRERRPGRRRLLGLAGLFAAGAAAAWAFSRR